MVADSIFQMFFLYYFFNYNNLAVITLFIKLQFIMRIKKIIGLILFAIPIISCDPGSTVVFTIYNMSNHDATIELKENVWYNIFHKDSVSLHNSSEEGSAILKHGEFIRKYYEWMNNRVESYIPLWEEIISIKIGDSIVSPQYWDNEGCWQKSHSSGMYYENIDYSLYLTPTGR